LRKSAPRLVGTAIGAFAMVLIAAASPQDRVGFLGGLAVWAALCGFAGALLRNFAAYAAGLAGFTAAIIASDVIGPDGGANDDAAMFAIYRVAEIAIGIVSAGLVLALSDLGGARRRLSLELSSVAAAALKEYAGALSSPDPDGPQSRSARREAIRRAIALDPMIDTAIGEASDLRHRSRNLQDAVYGLVETISAWRVLEIHRGRSLASHEAADTSAIDAIVDRLPQSADALLRHAPDIRDACRAAARDASRVDASSPAAQLMADTGVTASVGMARALNGLTLVVDPARTRQADAVAIFYVPDWLPALIVALRAFVATGLVSLFFIVSPWPGGMAAVTFTVIVSVLFPLQGDRAYSAALGFFIGCTLSALIAATMLFVILPKVSTFAGLSLTLGAAFVPLGVLIAWPFEATIFGAASFNLIPFLGLQNAIVYDAAQFWNSVLAILFGVAAGVVMIRLIPPPSPRTRTRRLLRFALRDVRRLAQGSGPLERRAWEARALARLMALPDAAAPIDRAYMAAALAVGRRILRLRRIAPRFAPAAALEAALVPIAEGRIDDALAGLAAFDRELTAAAAKARIALRLRAALLAISEELTAHPEFFGRGA
jgi:uncharacterized membrane protein YccC